MRSARNIHNRFSFKLALFFVYLPFLLVQFSYKFYVIANFYYFLSHQAYVASNSSPSHKIQKQKAYQSSYYDTSHLTLDKRYSHKVSSDGISYFAAAPAPVYIELNTIFLTTASCISSTSFTISSPRAPPCA